MEAEAALPWPRIQLRHTQPLQHSSPLHAVILAADATSRLERTSHRTMDRRHFVNSVSFIYDTGFYPYDYWYPYGYAYGYYGSAYYPLTTMPGFMKATLPI